MVAHRFPVEAGHIMMFARAIGDPNPIYYDEEFAAGTEWGAIIAPPTFVRAASHYDPDAARPTQGVPWKGSGREASGLPPHERPPGSLHAEQHFEYHRQIRAGDVLSAQVQPGRTWQRPSGSGGTLHFTETITRYRDQDGNLCVTSRSVSVVKQP